MYMYEYMYSKDKYTRVYIIERNHYSNVFVVYPNSGQMYVCDESSLLINSFAREGRVHLTYISLVPELRCRWDRCVERVIIRYLCIARML